MANQKFFGKWLLWPALFLILLVWLSMIIPYWRPDYWSARSSLNAVKNSLQARGEPITYADLASQDEDAYVMGDRVLAIVNKLTRAEREFEKLRFVDPPIPPGDYAPFREALQKNREVLDTLAAIDATSECRFRYDFAVRNPAGTFLPSMDGLCKAGHLWRADFLQALGTGDEDRAVQATIELCDTSQLMSREPFLVNHKFRARVGGEAIDALQLLLARVDFSPEQFRAIDDRLVEMESSYRLTHIVVCERAMAFTMMENIGTPEVRKFMATSVGLGQDGYVFSSSPRKSRLDRWASLAYQPKRMRQQAWMLDRLTKLADLIDVPGADAERLWRSNHDEIKTFFKSNRDELVFQFFPALESERLAGLAYRQRLVASRLALRVSRYQLEKGSLPNSLEEVLDDTMPRIPLGLISGLAPEYIVHPGSFSIREATGSQGGQGLGIVEVNYQAESVSR